MRKKFVFAAVVLALVCIAYGGWHWWTDWRFMQSTDYAYVASDVSVISPKVEGYIKEVHIRDNEAVKKGAVLFVIDDSDFAAKVAQAQAAVATEQAAVATYVSRLDLQQAMIAQAQATLASGEADLVRTQLDFKRYAALMTTDFASRQRYEQAQADARKAEAEAQKDRAALMAAQSQLGVLQSQRGEPVQAMYAILAGTVGTAGLSGVGRRLSFAPSGDSVTHPSDPDHVQLQNSAG